MNSNGDQTQSTYALDSQRGHQPKYRGQRRGRGRGGSEKFGGPRSFRDRKPSNWREGQRNAPEVIDLHDSSQWPSIQESSQGSTQRRPSIRSPEAERNETSESLRFKQNNNQNASYRDHAGRFPNRSRYARFNGQNRFNPNFNRRYLRGNFQNSGYIPDPMMGGFVNGQFVVPPVFPTSHPANDNRPKEPIDPLEQVEFYFSTFNLETDFYMRQQMDKEGWVDLALIFKFKRIQSLELEFNDFVSKLQNTENIEIDQETKRVRAKNEPEKWVINPETRIAAMIGSNPHLAQYLLNGEIDINSFPVNPYGGFPPMFFPVPNFSGRGGRYIPQYGLYPSPVYGFPFPEFSPEANQQYFYPEYSGNYFPTGSNSQPFNNSSQKADETEQSSKVLEASQEPLPLATFELNTNSEIPTEQESEVEDLSKKVLEVNISSNINVGSNSSSSN